MKKIYLAIIILFAAQALTAAELDLTAHWQLIDNSQINEYCANGFNGPLFMHGMTYSSVLEPNLLSGMLYMGATAMGAYQESSGANPDQLGLGYGAWHMRWVYPIAGFIEAGLHTELACGIVTVNGTTTVFDSFIALEPSAYLSFQVFIFKLKITAGYFLTLGGSMGNFKMDGFCFRAIFGFNLPRG
jgi:hypothetical protein